VIREAAKFSSTSDYDFIFVRLNKILQQTSNTWHHFYHICDNWIESAGEVVLGVSFQGLYPKKVRIPNPTRLLVLIPQLLIQVVQTTLFGLSRLHTLAESVTVSDFWKKMSDVCAI